MRFRWEAPVLLAVLTAYPACRPPPAERGVQADSLLAPGESLYVRGAFDSASARWTQMLAAPGVAGTATEARLVHWLGLAAYRQGEYAEARRLGERALSLKRERGLGRTEIAESQNALGLLAWNEGRLQDAAALLSDALAGFSADGDRAGMAKASNNLALVALELGRFVEAREGFGTARVAARQIGNARIEGRATTNLAMMEIWTGDPSAAPVLLEESRRLADSAADPVGLENALGQLAVAWSVLGEPGRALATLDSATAIARRHELREEEANNLLVAASIHREAGDADRALQLFAEARAINEELGLAVERGMVLRSEALLLASRGVMDRARSNLVEALQEHRTAEARLEEFHDLQALVDLESRAGNLGAAGQRLAESRRLAAELDAPQTRAALALTEARAADRRADPGGVLSPLRNVTSDLELSGAAASVEAEWLRTRAFAALGRLDSAVVSGRRAVAAIQRSAGTFGSPVLRASSLSERSEVFADLVLSLLRLEQAEEAFMVADAARGRAFLDHLARVHDVVRLGGVAADVAERDRLLRAIDALLGRLEAVQTRPRQERGPADEATSRELADRLRQARGEYEAVLIRLAERDPGRAGLIGARPLTFRDVQTALEPDELLVQYLATPERLITFAVTPAAVKWLDSPVALTELENRVRLARGLISSPTSGDSPGAVLEELYRILMGPLESAGLLGSARRLLLVPHGVLSYLPFAALRNPGSGRFLIQEHVVSYLPTASGLAALRSGSRVQAGGRLAVFAPLPDRLAATALETAAIERTSRGSQRVMGTSATEQAVRRALAEGRVVHVATHGVMNPVNPMFSSLRLARGAGQSAEDDGRLEVHELLGMRIRSPLVFLSGCETALGGARTTPFDRGQDYATLAQAFLYAGARGVIATLWRIDDQGAAHFAERFYRGLPKLSAGQAVAAAQRSMIGDPRWGHPYYWAGYTLAGDGPAPPGENRAAASVSR